MKIVKAMKKVARLKGEIKDLKSRMDSCLNTDESNNFSEDYTSLKKELFSKTSELIRLKTGILHTNVSHGMSLRIMHLGELKSFLSYIKEQEPKIGKSSTSHYSEETRVFKSQMTIKEKNDLIALCQKKINEITDELDDFNALTHVSEIVPDDKSFL